MDGFECGLGDGANGICGRKSITNDFLYAILSQDFCRKSWKLDNLGLVIGGLRGSGFNALFNLTRHCRRFALVWVFINRIDLASDFNSAASF